MKTSRTSSMHAVIATLLFLASVASASAVTAAPQVSDAELIVPGGTAAALETAGAKAPPERWSRVLTLIRLLHHTPQGDSKAATEALAAVTAYFDAIARFQDALGGNPRVALKTALPGDRRRLEAVLDVAGYDLRERNGVVRVEPSRNREASERCRLLQRAGVQTDKLDTRLNAGETVELAVRSEVARLPLSAKLWCEVVFEGAIPVDRLFAAILLDRRAALLYYGLASLDASTLAYLAGDRDLLGRLYRDSSETFATFGRSLHVANGVVSVPAGDAARPVWEAIVDEKATAASRFVRRLFERDNGRLAWFYDAVQHLDQPRQRYALCFAVKDAGDRANCARDVYAVFQEFEPSWRPARQPFSRRPVDPFLALTHVSVTDAGVLAAPGWKRLWEVAFQSDGLPPDPGHELRNLLQDGLADAPWLLRSLATEDERLRRLRVNAVAFAQRAFSRAATEKAPDVLVAACASMKYETLMLTLERAGLSDPATYARAAMAADSIVATGDTDRLPLQLAAFQSPLALIDRAARNRTLDAAAAEALVASFVALPRGDEAPRGELARWIEADFLPRLPAAAAGEEDSAEARLLRGLSGRVQTPRSVEWEERTYRVDVAAAEFARLKAIREKQRDNSVDAALRLWRVAASMSSASPTVEQAANAAARLREVAADLQPLVPGPLLGRQPPRLAETIERALSDLGKIKKPKDAWKMARVAVPLAALADAMLTQTLASLAYAVGAGDPQSPLFMAENIALQHDFGLETVRDEERRARQPWTLANEQSGPQVRWHMRGSLLALDVGLARLALRRLSTEPPRHAPTLNESDVRTAQQAIPLMNPFVLTDSTRDSIVAALKAGRMRVARLVGDPSAFDGAAAEGHLGEWRRHAMEWIARHEPDALPGLFALGDLLWLGQPDADRAELDAWGAVAIPLAGGLRLTMPAGPGWESLSGRPTTGLLAAAFADVGLSVAEALADRRLPAQLAPAVAAAVTQLMIEDADMTDEDDWPSLVRCLRALSRAQIDDCISSLTSGGPLMPMKTDGS